MKRIISLFSLFILLFVNIVTPVTYAMDGEDSSSESVSESTESSVDADDSVGEDDDSSDTEASDDAESDEGTESDDDSESSEDSESDVTDEESSDEEASESTEGDEELEESLENSASSSTGSEASVEGVSVEEEIELLCKQEGAPENAHYLSSDDDASDVNCKWECDSHYALSEDGLSCTQVEESAGSVVTDSKGNSEEVKSCEIPENAQKIENSNLTGEKCEWECSQGYLITKAGDACEEINFSKYKNEPSVDALCHKLGLSWVEEKGDLAKLAGIDDYVGSREQNESIRVFLVDHVEDILKGKFNIQEEVVEKNKGYVYTNDVVLNAEEIKGESTYNNITVNVEAPIGSFPEGTTLKIKPITKKKELKEIEDQIITQQDNVDETLELLAFDISFFYDEKEVQPVEGKTVQVTFDYAENKKLTEADSNENKELKVYHLDDKDENGNKVEEVEVKEVEVNQDNSEEGKLAVDAEGFSVYVLTLQKTDNSEVVVLTLHVGENGKLEISENNGLYSLDGNSLFSFTGSELSGEYSARMYKNSESKIKLPTPINSDESMFFEGWYENENYSVKKGDAGAEVTINGDTDLYAKWSTCRVMINDSCYVNLKDALNAANSGDTLEFVTGVAMNLNDYITIKDKTITIDLGGHTFDINQNGCSGVSGKGFITIEGSSIVTIINGKISDNNKDGWSCSNYSLLLVKGSAKLVLGENLNVIGQQTNDNDYHYPVIKSVDNGMITINGASVDAGRRYILQIFGNSKFEMLGSSMLKTTGGLALDIGDQASANILDGVIEAGTIIKVGDQVKLKISGGKFNKEVDSRYFVEGYTMTELDGKYAVIFNPVAIIGTTGYSSLTRAINAVENGMPIIIELYNDVNEDVVIPEGKNIILETEGKKITNISGHTITNNGTLTINGNGTVDNITHGKAAIYNGVNGTLTIAGGTFERSLEAGADASNNGGNSYYTIKNLGKITIKGGTFKNNGAYSSMFANGYYNANEVKAANNNGDTPSVSPTLVIDDGLFDGGLNTVKNDDFGVLTINGGEFINQAQTAFQNHNKAIVNGGLFSPKNNASAIMLGRFGSSAGLSNEGIVEINTGVFEGGISLQDANKSGHKLTINGGIFEKKGNNPIFPNVQLINTEIKGGVFAEDPSAYVAAFYFVKADENKFVVVEFMPDADSLDGNYAADPSTAVSGTELTGGENLKDLIVDVEKKTVEEISETQIPARSGNSNIKPLGQVVLSYKKDGKPIKNVKFNKTILVKIPVAGKVKKVFVVAKHGDDAYGFTGLATGSDSCGDGVASNKIYTGGLLDVKDGYVSIYTCQASIFTSGAPIYHAKLNADTSASSAGTKDIYYAYETNEYYTEASIESGRIENNIIEIPSKKGYVFEGYFSGNTKVISETGLILDNVFNVDSDNTYTAQYNRGTHTFSYASITSGTLNGGTVSGLKEYNDDIILMNPTITDPDYEFNGWNLYSGTIEADAISGNDVTAKIELTCNDNECRFKMPNHNVIVKAKVEKREYTITFDSNGGTDVEAQSGIIYNHTGTKPEDPTKNGFTFSGWYLEGQDSEFDFENTLISGNITLKAQWKEHGIYGPFYTSIQKGGLSFKIALFTGGVDAGKIDENATLAQNSGYTKAQLLHVIGNDIENTIVEIVNIPDLGGDQLFLKVLSGSTYITKGFCSTEGGCNYYTSSGSNFGSVSADPDVLNAMDIDNVTGPSWAVSATTGNYSKYLGLTGGFMVFVKNDNVDGYIYVPYKEFSLTYDYGTVPYWTENLPQGGTYKYNQDVTVASLPTAQGYTFTGWFLDGEVTGSFKMPAKDVKLTGEFLNDDSNYRYHYELEKLDGNWETTGGNYGLIGNEGTKFNLPVPLKTFIGFSLTGDYSNLVIRSGFNFPIKFARNKYYLGYSYKNINGAETKKGYNIKFDADVTVLEEPTLTGYTFKWNGGYTGGKTFKMPAKTLTITGEFIPNTDTAYTVEHYQEKLDGTYELKDTDDKTGTTDTDIEVVLKNYEGFTGGIYSGAKIGADGKTVVKVKYARNIHSITFNSNSGSAVEPQEYIKYNGTGTEPAEPARTGYNFTGWYKDGSESKFDFNTPITENIILVAKWEPKTVEYSFVTRVENINDSNYTRIGTENRTGDIASEIKIQSELSGMVFVGFRVNKVRTDCEEGEDVCYYKIPDNSTGGTIDVHYKRNPITISFDNNSGTGEVEITAKYGSGITLPTPVRTGYDFKGWGENNLSGTYTVSENTGFVANWVPATGTKYTVEYYLQNLSGTDYDLTGAATEILSGTTNDTGYALVKPFTGFTLNETSSQQTGIITASGDLVLKLKYDRNTYDVNYEFSGNVPEGVFVPAKSGYKFGETVSVESGVLVSGYNFDGWYKDGELTGAFIMPATGVVLTGSFAPRRVNYQFHYEIEDLSGNFIPNGNVYVRTGRAGSLNENPKEEPLLNYIRKSYPGFSLSGTMDDYRETIKGDGSTDIAIQLKRNQYNVEYTYEKAVTGASELPASGTYKYEAPVTIAPLATASGYDFVWTGYEGQSGFNMPAEDVVITGVFTPRNDTPYTVGYYYQRSDGKYYLSGSVVRTGTTEDEVYVESGDKISQDPSSYIFSESGSVLTGTISGDGKLELKVYFKGSYTVKYIPGDDKIPWFFTTSGLEYGTDTPEPTTDVRWLGHPEGYVFDGWSPEVQPRVTGNVTYVAKWAPKNMTYKVEYYQENLSGEFEKIETLNLSGETASHVEAEERNDEGFTLSGAISTLSGNIKGDGSLVLKLYYTRNTYNLNYGSSYAKPSNRTLKFGQDIIYPDSIVRTGHELKEWNNVPEDGKMPATGLNLWPSWNTGSYTITFNTNGGTSIEAISGEYNSNVTSPSDPTRDGYTFSGWDKTIPSIMPAEDLTINANWSAINYNVVFDENEGTEVDDLTYTIECGINALPEPIRTGFIFTGWYDNTDTKVENISTGTTGNINLTAHWEASIVNYTVKHYKEAWEDYDRNGKKAEKASDGKWYYADKVETHTGIVNSEIKTTDSVVKPIAKYKGFTYDEEAPNVRSGTIASTGLELKLYYKRNIYSVSFDSDGGSSVTGQEVGFYLTPTKPENPTKEGYTFSGWTLSGNDYSFKNGYVEGDIELKAEWTPNKYTVKYDANGASGSAYQVAYDYDQSFKIYVPVDYSMTGHDFIGWSTTSTGDVEYTGGQTVSKLATTGDVTLYAVWKAKEYKITFVDEDGTTVIGEFTGAYGENPKSFWTEDPIQQKDDWKCKFKEWSPAPVAITGEATYKATYYPMGSDSDKCSFSYYTVTFVNEDGSDLQKGGHIGYGSEVEYTGATPEKAADEQYSYVFSGWNPELISGAIVTGDMVYTAVYTPVLRQYNVTWTNWDGSEIKVDTGIDYGTVPEFSGTTPTRPADEVNAYEFSGWLPTIKAITGDITYTADFKKVNRGYTIIWSGNNDNNQTNKEVIQYWQQDIQVQPDPVKTGYVFAGWYPEVISGTTKVKGDTTYVAQWAPATNTPYKVEYRLENLDGTGFDLEQTDDLSGTTEGLTEATGHLYSGFTLSGDIEQKTIAADGLTVVKVEYSRTVYPVTFDTNGGSAISGQNVKYEKKATKPENPIKTGYKFSEWTLNGESFDFETPITGKVTLTGTWTPNTYTVKFDKNGGEGTGYEQEFAYDEEKALTGNAYTKKKFNFSGWNTEANGSGTWYESGAIVKNLAESGEVTLYAQWNPYRYEVIFDPNGGTGEMENQIIYARNNQTLSKNKFTWKNHIFSGWATNVNGKGTKYTDEQLIYNFGDEGAITLYAQWKEGVTYTVIFSGTDLESQEVESGTVVTVQKPSKEGYEFTGWTLSGEAFNDDSIVVTGDIELVAHWIQNTYTVEFDPNGGTGEMTPQVFKFGSGELLNKNTFVYTGFKFKGWSSTSDGNVEYEDNATGSNIVTESGSIKLYAQWNKLYKVVFSGTNLSSQDVESGTEVEVPEPSKEGYEFTGWTLNGEPFTDTGIIVTGDTNLEAGWKAKVLDITYVLNSGDNNSGNVKTFTVEDRVHLYDATRSGYVFDGWHTVDNISGSTKVSYIEKGTTTGQTLFAQWTPVKDAIDNAKSGDKTPVVSSDVTIDVAANSGDAEYKSGNIPTETPIFDENLRTVVGSGEYEEYSLVGIERTITQSNNPQTDFQVNPSDLDIRTGYVATIVGGLEVFVKKITRDLDGNPVAIERNTKTVNFSKPVAIPIHIKTSATNVKIRVNHGSGYGLTGLSADMNTACNADGTATIPYTGGLIPVENSYAWIYTCSASAFVAYTEAPKSSGGGTSGGSTGGGGGGGGSSYSSSTSNSSTSNSTIKTPSASDINLSGKIEEPNKACLYVSEEAKIKYGDELLEAYLRAYANGVVSTDDVDAAKVYRYITRAELAKIMVQYVAGVLHRSPIVEENANYSDVDSSLGTYANYINLAYQYQLMGINADGTPLKEFNPAGLVTRGEFASVLSRVIYGDKYNVDGTAFYSMHIDVLNQAGVLDNTNPSILEKIEWVLLMLKRASKDLPNTKKASDVKICPISPEDEQKAAYEWALKYGITSIDDPYAARLSDGLTRAEFAKMMVQYMINVLHKKPVLNKDVDYIDVNGSLGDLEGYIKLAYQYQIMGIHGNGEPLTEFEPNRILTRKEFATVFSRILFGDKYNIDGQEYWTNHIKALKEISVLTNGDPALLEIRGWVMLMMYRSAEDAKNVNI